MPVDSNTRSDSVGWRLIETAPKDWLRNFTGRCLIGCWHEPLDEDGEPIGVGDWAWVHVANLSHDGWHVGTYGFRGVHGFASFPLHGNATHWMPLPTPPALEERRG